MALITEHCMQAELALERSAQGKARLCATYIKIIGQELIGTVLLAPYGKRHRSRMPTMHKFVCRAHEELKTVPCVQGTEPGVCTDACQLHPGLEVQLAQAAVSTCSKIKGRSSI